MGEPVQSLPTRVPNRMRCCHRDPEDNFFCIRYQVWYPSFDCAVRTKFRTSDGCRDCEQGRFNLKRHSVDLRNPRLRLSLFR